MKLYTGDLSPYSAKIRMQIYAMGIEDEVEFQHPPVEFVLGKMSEVSPIGRIPVLETSSGLIPESEVIAEYLDEKFPERALLGETPDQRADVRVISRIGDIYLMNNIFLALGQLNPETRNEGVRDLLVGQVARGLGALEQHLGDDAYAAGDSLTRADCSLVPALWMCAGTVPRLGVEEPLSRHQRVSDYWARIQENEHAARVIAEMNQGLKERMDGTERRRAEEMIAQAQARDGASD